MPSCPYIVVAVAVAIAMAGAVANGACDGSSTPSIERASATLMAGPNVDGVPGVDVVPECPIEESTCVEVAPAVTEAQACPGDRWIAYLGAGGVTCPGPRLDLGWDGGPLFEAVGDPLVVGAGPGAEAVLRLHLDPRGAAEAGRH
jgi:hypothetical protein